MGAKHDELRTIADSRFGSGNPVTWYIAVSTTVSNADGTGFTEPVAAGYARVAVTNNAVNFPGAATAGGTTSKTSGAKVTFPNPTGAWGNLVEWGAFTTSSGGTPRYTNPLDTSISPKAGNTPVEFDVGQLVTTWA